MKIRPFPYAAGHPANHGYVQCANCRVWRPGDRLSVDLVCIELRTGCGPSTEPSHLDAPPLTEPERPKRFEFTCPCGNVFVCPKSPPGESRGNCARCDQPVSAATESAAKALD